jgi:hypothetical protein
MRFFGKGINQGNSEGFITSVKVIKQHKSKGFLLFVSTPQERSE